MPPTPSWKDAAVAIWLRVAAASHRHLVGLSMPRALEILEDTVRQLEQDSISPLEAVEALLAEELALRERRRIRIALQVARLTAPKTLAGFDFTFQP